MDDDDEDDDEDADDDDDADDNNDNDSDMGANPCEKENLWISRPSTSSPVH